jgi:hypothetical protein
MVFTNNTNLTKEGFWRARKAFGSIRGVGEEQQPFQIKWGGDSINTHTLLCLSNITKNIRTYVFFIGTILPLETTTIQFFHWNFWHLKKIAQVTLWKTPFSFELWFWCSWIFRKAYLQATIPTMNKQTNASVVLCASLIYTSTYGSISLSPWDIKLFMLQPSF